MVTIDRMKSIEDLKYDAYIEVSNYREGVEAAISYFKEIHENNGHDGVWDDEMVSFYGPKKFRNHNEETGMIDETTVYESYIDSGSVDYFFFSFKNEL